MLYLDPLEIGAIAFARRLGVPRTRIERLIKGTTGITPDTALRLARVFNTTPAYWVNLQTNYDMALATKEIDVSDIEPLVAAESTNVIFPASFPKYPDLIRLGDG